MTYATLMVHLKAGEPNAGLLRVSGELAERFDANVIGIAARQPLQLLYDNGFSTTDVIGQDFREIQKALEAAEAEFQVALHGRAKSLEWRSSITIAPLFEYLAHQARAADLVLSGPNSAHSPLYHPRYADLGRFLMLSGRPLLIVPEEIDRLKVRRMVVAWKDKREARRAVADALPLLNLAGQVSVVEIANKLDMAAATTRVADVASWLGRHGIAAEPMAVPAAEDDANRLAALADDYQADLIVAGAYGHSQLREALLGGVTRDLLLRSDRCAFLSH
ncbi:universal stress protein [Acidisoma sp. L85]|uniref:universal stress protein n=1 Tax=Acidisoma sp. L85 TaxID=1641850 RepID=UPI00131EC6A1|nr:universal stress protein [Acidisoma sp. L85]